MSSADTSIWSSGGPTGSNPEAVAVTCSRRRTGRGPDCAGATGGDGLDGRSGMVARRPIGHRWRAVTVGQRRDWSAGHQRSVDRPSTFSSLLLLQLPAAATAAVVKASIRFSEGAEFLILIHVTSIGQFLL